VGLMGRGYRHGWGHRKARAWWAPRVTPGVTPCVYGDGPVGVDWDLAHDDDNPGRYLGPAHPSCNRSRSRESPAAKAKPHNWSNAYKIMKAKRASEDPNTTSDDPEIRRRSRLGDRERRRLERLRRRTIILPDSDSDE
jgi:hypothetical protein